MPEFHAAQGDVTPYVCGSCQEPVFILDGGRVIRPCGCPDNTALIANMEAVCRGYSSLAAG